MNLVGAVRNILACMTMLAACSTASSGEKPSPHIVGTDPLRPQEQQKVLHVPEGFEVQLVAAEPDIINPINIAFDARGRLWVSQSIEYPFPAAVGSQTRDAIKILEDFGPNGRARKITTFADNVNIPIGVLPTSRGAIVFSIPNIYHMIDTDGDGRADKRQVLYSGYGYKDTHGMTGEFMWGFDGWIYACHGFANTSNVKGAAPEQITMQSGNTYRIKEDGSRIEYFTHGQVNPFGLAFDPLGNLYSCDCHTRPLYQLLRGAWYPSFGKPHDGLGFGPEMVTHSHGSTAIAGLAYYDDDRFPGAFRDNLFIGNVVTNRINRDRLQRHGATYKGIEMPDFVRSDDRWFRPVDIKLGPDGALYVADFYDRIIGHYEVPLTHPGRDKTHGRIWRIIHRGTDERPVRDLYRAAVAELVDELNSPNIGVRIQATNQLVERGDNAVAPLIKVLEQGSASQRVHALWALARLGALDDSQLATAARSPDAVVRVHAQRVLAERRHWNGTHQQLALDALKDTDAFVQRAAADALGCHPDSRHVTPLLTLRRGIHAEDTHLLHVVRMALRDQLKEETLAALHTVAFSTEDAHALADVCLGIKAPASAAFVLAHLERYPSSRLDVFAHHAARYDTDGIARALAFGRTRLATKLVEQATVIRAVHRAAQERGARLESKDLEQAASVALALMRSPDHVARQHGVELVGELRIAAAQQDLVKLAADQDAFMPQRMAACTALAAIDVQSSAETLLTVLLSANELPPLREHVARTLAQSNRPAVEARLAKALAIVSARLQAVIAEGLAGSKTGAQHLLEAIAQGKASARLLQDRNLENRLKNSGVPGLQGRLTELTRGLPSANAALQQVLGHRQQGFVAAKADVKQGQLVFEKHCAVCHQLHNKGNKIGPQLDGIGMRGLERLLEDVLDPNRNVDQEFRATTLVMKDGQVVVGLYLRQEGQVLVLADNQGKELRVPADSVEMRIVSQLSPMPSNHAEQIGEGDFYHLMRYLLEQREPATSRRE